MKEIQLLEGAAVRVFWRDSATKPGWQHGALADLAKVVTVGFKVHSTKDALCVASSIDDQWSTHTPLSIPWAAIEKVEIYEIWNRNRLS